MGRILAAAAVAAIALSVPPLLAVTGLRLVADETFVRFEYGRSWFPEDPGGLTEAERIQLGFAGLHAILPGDPDGLRLARAMRLPSGEPAFRPRELRHLEDVRARLGGAFRFQLVGLAALAVLAVAFGLAPATRTLVPRALRAGALLTLLVAGAVAALVLTRYDTFSTPFHRLLFDGDSWRFADSDTLRRLYPDVFWRDTAIAVGAVAVVQALVLAWAAAAWTRRAHAGSALRPRPRTHAS